MAFLIPLALFAAAGVGVAVHVVRRRRALRARIARRMADITKD